MRIRSAISLVFLIALLFFSAPDGSTGMWQRSKSRTDSINVRNAASARAMDTLRKLPNTAFAAGENLKFTVYYGPVAAGEAVMKISDTTFHNRRCYGIEFSMKTKPLFDFFYKINDKYLSAVDV